MRHFKKIEGYNKNLVKKYVEKISNVLIQANIIVEIIKKLTHILWEQEALVKK